MNTLLVAATSAFLVIAPFAGSAGSRVTMLLLAAIALVATRRQSIDPALPALPRAVVFAFGAWAALAAASLAWSVDRAYTASELRAEIAYGALALAVFFFAAQDPARWPRWMAALAFGSLAMLAMPLVQSMVPFPLSRHASFEQRGPWSTHLVLVAPLALAVAWPRPWGVGRGVGWAALALAVLFVAAWSTHGRIVWVALGAQIAVAMALWRAAPEMEPARRRDVRRLVLAAAVVAAVAFAAAVVERNAYLRPGASLSATLAKDVRPRIWSAAWGHFVESPWIGHGFGRGILAERFATETPRRLHHPKILHGHNVFVNVALQLGLAGLAVFIALLLALGREYAGLLRRPEVAPYGLLGLMLLAGFLAKCLTDDFLHRHNALVFWAMNAMLIGMGRARAA